MKRILTFLFVCLLMFGAPVTALAAEPGTGTGWLRAKLTYEFENGITGMDDSAIDFAEGWEKSGDWYYYQIPVEPKDTVRFITGVQIPAEWTEELQNKEFSVIVTVEAAEASPGVWTDNTEVLYEKQFDLLNTKDSDLIIQEGSLDVEIVEYELDKDGKEVPYQNNKMVTPGQFVSKIVDFELSGSLGTNTWREIIKTGEESFLFLIGLAMAAGAGYLYVKRRKQA